MRQYGSTTTTGLRLLTAAAFLVSLILYSATGAFIGDRTGTTLHSVAAAATPLTGHDQVGHTDDDAGHMAAADSATDHSGCDGKTGAHTGKTGCCSAACYTAAILPKPDSVSRRPLRHLTERPSDLIFAADLGVQHRPPRQG